MNRILPFNENGIFLHDAVSGIAVRALAANLLKLEGGK